MFQKRANSLFERGLNIPASKPDFTCHNVTNLPGSTVTRLIGLLDPHQPFQICTVCQMIRGNIQGVDVFNNSLAELNCRDIATVTFERYSQIIGLYRCWLDENGRFLDHESA